jgi:hypothetical protein
MLDRRAAIGYAKKYWNRVCDDDLIGAHPRTISVTQKRKELHAPAPRWEAVFVDYPYSAQVPAEKAVFRDIHGIEPNKDIQLWEGLLDCAHYLSRCLTAEGIPMQVYGVAELVKTLKARRDTKTLAEKVSRVQGQRVVDCGILKPGDMIGYFNTNPHGYHAGRYGHSGMYVGKDDDSLGGMTCHTTCRFSGKRFPDGYAFGDSWYLHDPEPEGDSFLYTFIHFSDDDQPLTGTIVNALPGWWKLEVGRTTAYYHVTRSGTAGYSSGAPRREFDQPPRGNDSAYYFRDGSKIIFIWRQTGNVAVWTMAGDRAQFNVALNGASGRATKVLFTHRGGPR